MQAPIGAAGAIPIGSENTPDRVRPELYVANRGNNTITLYRGRRKKPVQTISNGVGFGNFSYLLLDKAGNLYSANYEANTVTVYAIGSVNPQRTISDGLDGPRASEVFSSNETTRRA
jgi:DNA-binding beta-propeller fold protein YncE